MLKAIWTILGAYALYIVFIVCYFFFWTTPGVPANVKGTAADPSEFMSTHQVMLSQNYSELQNFMTFLTLPLDWVVYAIILIAGLSYWLQRRSKETTRFSLFHTLIYFLALSIITWIISLPFNYISHLISFHYHVSVETFGPWFKDALKSFWVNWIISFVTIAVILFFIRRYPRRWWLPIWLLSIPFILFMMYIQPVVIDPIFDHIHPLQDGKLKNEILTLAEDAGIPAHNVYEINKSDETNAMNAYVNGIGSNMRIVLWDTTVKNMSDKEVLFVMAHEMGHYVQHHLIWSGIGTVIMLLLGLYLIARLHDAAVKRFGHKRGISHPGDLAALPILLLIMSFLSFAAMPLENAVSRIYEHRADKYAIELTNDKKAGIESFHELTKSGLSDVNPPALVKYIMYSHPPMMQRIEFVENYRVNKNK